ncbi:MAG: translation initiation factor IF-1 [Myxococcota bacterium]|nr:translation initiation factor IF-1 [Myxococcota bacterium]
MSADVLTFEGVVVSAERGYLYHVDCVVGGLARRIIARRAGKLIKHHLRLLPGDRVEVDVSPYDTTRGRVTKRL